MGFPITMDASESAGSLSSLKVFIALTPPLIWLLYFREREGFATSFRVICIALAMGSAVSYPAFLIQRFLATSPDISFRWFHDLTVVRALTLDGSYAHVVVPGIIFGGMIEEGIKLVGILAVFWCLRSSLRPAHLTIVGLAVGCGFAVIENSLTYLHTADWQHVALIRSLSGSHVVYGATMGSFLALGFTGHKPVATFSLAVIVPMLLHAAYNHALAMNVVGGDIGVLARIIFTAVVLISMLLAVFLLTMFGDCQRIRM